MPIDYKWIAPTHVTLTCELCPSVARFTVQDEHDVMLGCDDVQWRCLGGDWYCPKCAMVYVERRKQNAK